MGVRVIEKGKTGAWYPMNETAVQRLNDPEHITGRRVRIGKFYFPHGSSAFRECPNCGKLTCFLGDSWGYDSETLFPPQIINNGGVDINPRSMEEREARNNGVNDAVQCIHCGAITEAHHSAMIMQTNFKGGHPPYIEEIQRDMKVAIENAKHIILFGYSFPSDDFIYHSIFAARKRLDDQLKCSIVGYGSGAPDKWLSGQELKQYVEQNESDGVAVVYKNVKPLFNEKNIRLYGKGIPEVFLFNNAVSKTRVDQLLDWC